MAHTIEAARLSKFVDRIIVSTNSKTIADIANKYGAETPFLRPQNLSDDKTTSEEALLHTLRFLNLNENYFPEIILYMQATEPFRPKGIIDKCIETLINDSKLDSVFAGLIKHKNYWIKTTKGYQRLGKDYIESSLPRQIKQPTFREDTGIALATRANVIKDGKRIGSNIQIIEYESNIDFIDIHTEFDLKLSEILIKGLNIEPNY